MRREDRPGLAFFNREYGNAPSIPLPQSFSNDKSSAC